ncbi:hypothetical protein [Sporosarcina luteola]|uniref:hypothetical protein n=1 Tax=Sporosarcina luteola TaxID=582850 RepID=UPI00203EA4F9|nr:hypothetical protein [Sporosarcina luteola]MCM3711834.1 hypothetical protein [Sporosarcina luteola]
MGQEWFEYDRNRFNLSEYLVADMFLLSYIFIFILGKTGSAIPYIWLLISIEGGVVSYFIFYSREYSVGLGVGLAAGVTVPLFLFGAPLLNTLIFFVYVYWRIQANFSGSRIHGWPFITVGNTAVFVSSCFLARLLFVNDHHEELLQQQLILYLLTSFLFYFIRLVTIVINSRRLGNFQVREAGKVFSVIVGLGATALFIVLIGLEPVRALVIKITGFLFGGVFMIFLKGIDPLMEFFRKGAERINDDNTVESGFRFFDFEEREATSSIFEYSLLVFVVVVLIMLTVALIVLNNNKRFNDRQEAYFFSFKGKREREKEQGKMLYDYSIARDEVRKSFEQFEKEAQKYKLHRYHEETVMEWFSRNGWENENILSVYNAVRYGSHTPSESEQNNFVSGLTSIKKSFFVKKV